MAMGKQQALAQLPEVLRPGAEPLRNLAQRFGLRLVVLFGSRARGTARRTSDYDLAVSGLLRPSPRRQHLSTSEANALRRLHAELQHLLRTSRIDLVVLERAPALLAHRVAREGIPLLEAEPGEFARFCVRAVQRMEDARRFADAERRYLQQQFAARQPEMSQL